MNIFFLIVAIVGVLSCLYLSVFRSKDSKTQIVYGAGALGWGLFLVVVLKGMS